VIALGSFSTIAGLTPPVLRAQLEYPTVNVSFAYLASINKTKYVDPYVGSYAVVTRDTFADKAVWSAVQVNIGAYQLGRLQNEQNYYVSNINIAASSADHTLEKLVNRTSTTLATEATDLGNIGLGQAISCSGSLIRSNRYDLSAVVDPLNLPTSYQTIYATDTSFASGYFGFRFLRESYPHGGCESGSAWLKSSLSPLPPAQAVLELGLEGSGRGDDPFKPSLSKNLAEIDLLTGLPDFLYLEARKYSVLKSKGFTDDEMRLLFGYIPQHQVDLDAVTWGAFELQADKSPTAIITITGNNPYKSGAVDRQKAKAKRVFTPPKDYDEAVSLYNTLKKDYPHWLAGKDNFAYQALGLEVFEWFQNVDFYYGELIEHKTHYQQLKQVPDFEIRNRLSWLTDTLSKVVALVDERDKHIAKAREVLSKGW
jgi:hypothetical protein